MELLDRNLKDRKIAVLLADGFEMAEYTVPVNALRAAGASTKVISLRRGRIRGVNLHEPAHRVSVDLTIEQASPKDFDALFIPGGFINPDLLRQSQKVRSFVAAFAEAGKPIATLCHGPWVLASSGVLKGRALTSWAGIRDDMVNAGGVWLDQPVVRDGNLLTSRGPQDFANYIPALLEFFAESATEVASSRFTGATKSSPQRIEPPSLVLGTMKWMPRPSLRGFALGFAIGWVATLAQNASKKASADAKIPKTATRPRKGRAHHAAKAGVENHLT